MREESLAWNRRAHTVIPGGTSTLAKSTDRLGDRSPLYTARAKGPFFWDVDGVRWLDFEMAMGTAVWGYSHPQIIEAAARQLADGSSFSTPHVTEVLLAEHLLARFDNFEAVRFLKSGADAVESALRIARVATGRTTVVTTEYHGWGEDSVAGMYGPARKLGLHSSVVSESIRVEPGDLPGMLQALKRPGREPAAIVICPNRWLPAQVQVIQDAAAAAGTLTVFDEVTSGMRMGRRATAGEIGIWPDLLCLSKGLANGLPLAALFGSRKLLDYAVGARVTTAHATEAVSFAAAIASEILLAQQPEWPSWRSETESLIDGVLETLSGRPDLQLVGDYASFCIRTVGHSDFWSDPFRLQFIDVLAQRGMFSKGYVVPSAAHTPEHFGLLRSAITLSLDQWNNTQTH